ncbi:ABC transporter permease [Spiroplasma sp. SV19]|uniref:FtsX-like permease family protein n=1 Tax=Spiroplasma sp. SV19 TaxID=2570468 RepID=UPI0024B66D0E|nr:ABC transporter permease [Spiroplasma sp. SV19]WHQ37136.1 FtsX-like permease family protein [Spiroplasma sp. SV19]
MKKVLKSYIRTYLKQWVESLGLILFVTILSLAVIGILASPLQLSGKNKSINQEANTWNYSLISSPSKFENEFTYNYFVAESTAYNLAPIKGPNQLGILSQVGYDALKNKDNDPIGNVENQLAWGEDLKNILNNYFWWTETPTNLSYGGKTLLASEVFNDIFKDTVKNYYNDASYYVNSKIIETFQNQLALSVDLEFYYESYATPTAIAPDGYYYITSGTKKINPTLGKWIDNLVMLKGDNKTQDNKIVVTDKFAKDNNYHLNDKINFYVLGTLVPELNNPVISGFGTKVDTLSQADYFSMMGDPIKYAAVFVNDNTLNKMYQNVWLNQNKPKSFNFGINQKINFLNNSSFVTLRNAFAQKNNFDKSVYLASSGVLTAYDSLGPVSKISSMKVTTTIYTILGIGMIILAFIFISFVMKKEMNKTRKQLGIFKALGYRTSELVWIFTIKTLLTIMGGLILGYLLSIPLQIYMYGQFETLVTISYDKVYAGWGFMTIIFVIVPIFFTIASYITTFLYIKEPILSLVNNVAKGHKTVRAGIISRSLSKRGKAFTWRLQLAFTSRNKGKFALTIILFFFSSLLLILMLGATDVAKSITGGMFNMLNSKLDHTLTFNNFPRINGNGQKNGQLVISDQEYQQYDFKFKTYHNVSDITKTNQTAANFHEAFTKIDPTSPTAGQQYIALLQSYDVQDQNGNNQYLYLKDLKTIFTVMSVNNTFTQNKFDPNTYPNLMSLMLNAIMLDDGANSVVTFNDFWYNPNQETTFYSLPVILDSNLDEPGMTIKGLNNNGNVGGYYDNALNWTGISQQQVAEIFKPTNTPNKIKGLISYKLARNANYKTGDIFKVKTETPNKTSVEVEVVGVIKNNTVTDDIYTSYDNVMHNLFIANTIDPNQPEKNVYNGLYSQQKMYRGKIDLKNMAKSIQNLKFIGNNLAIAAKHNQSIWDALLNINTKTVTATLISTKAGSGRNDFGILPLNILRTSVDDMLTKMNSSMLMFELLVALIILILLVVVVMVIIDELIPIILTMKAIGYNNRKINFVVMGSYVIGVVVAFIMAWFASILIWQGLGILIYKLFKIVLNIPIDIKGPLIALVIITIILLTSWFMAMNSIKKRRVTEITN